MNLLKKNKKEKKTKKKADFLRKEDNYSNKDILVITISSTIFGFVFCLFILMFITGGKNLITICTDLRDFVKSYNALTENYYGELDKKDIISAAIQGMYSSIDDDYTTYLDSDSSESFEETINGKYEGIGCTVTMDEEGNIIINSIFEGTPSEEAGLKAGDIIKKVDGEDYTEKTSTELSNYIKNSENSKVILTILRDEEELEITVNRQSVEIPTVSSTTFEKNDKIIGYIQISSFSNVTAEQFKKELIELEDQKIEKLIIDVRSNGGGTLTSVTEIAELFLKKGKIIYQIESSNGIEKVKSSTKESRDYGIAILVNGNSASASEILASVIKESYGGYVIGSNTYGKGTIQETLTMSDGSIIKYTTKKWLTPDGNWINEVGVEPTDIVELSEDYYDNPIIENDTQLQKAIEILSE